jgi:hypothetical protein
MGLAGLVRCADAIRRKRADTAKDLRYTSPQTSRATSTQRASFFH